MILPIAPGGKPLRLGGGHDGSRHMTDSPEGGATTMIYPVGASGKKSKPLPSQERLAFPDRQRVREDAARA
jgi:hypothetical protein